MPHDGPICLDDILVLPYLQLSAAKKSWVAGTGAVVVHSELALMLGAVLDN